MPPYYAHSGESADLDHDGEPLNRHLRKVAEKAVHLAQLAARDATLSATAHATGLLHDLGKYQLEWQAYLQAAVRNDPSARSVPHAIHGAAYAYTALSNPSLAVCISGHHGGMNDCHAVLNLLEDGRRVPNAVLEQLLASARHELPELPTDVPMPAFNGSDEDAACRRLEFWTRILFSILVDADRLETEHFTTKRERSPVRLVPAALLEKLDAERAKRAAGKTDALTALRNRVYAACRAVGEQQPHGYFDLTVPTGGGKTLSAMAFALAHAQAHDMQRVFVVIPYLSIIEQNARDYRKVFGREVVLEHHSAVNDDMARSPSAEPYLRTSAELATENWDAPIVVTTSVQFLETLLAASTRRCRRLHNVARSVVVFDEAQCLPAHILNPLLDVFRDLKANWGCSVVFSTATQPAFRYSAIGLTHGLRDGELTPIVTGDLRDQLFRDLQRVNYRNETAAPLDWDDLVKRLVESSALCVLNTRRQAREVWEKLRGAVTDKYGPEAAKAVRHLSSAMCAEHRMDVLGRKDDVRPGTVYQRLRDGQPCWVVSTQVIECGVDVSFPRAYRALGPLDSIVQVAGRCNREGELYPCRGEVVIFQPADNGLPPGLYKMATGEAATLLNEVTAEQLATDATVFARYFATLYNRADVDAADIQRMRESFEFDAVATAARVIDDGGRSVTVPYKVAARWVASIRRRGTYTRADLRRLQRYTVNLRPNDFAESQRIGLVVPLLDGQPEGPCVLANGAYDPNFGVTLNGLTPEQYLV